MYSLRKILIILAAETALVTLADQVTKILVRAFISPHEPITLIPGLLNLVHWRNTGIAFGLFAEHTGILTALSLAALVAIPVFFLYEWKREPRISPAVWGLGLILGGALGNVLDRMRFGSVTDFIDVHLGRHHWPAFNVADSCICIGTGLVLYFAFRGSLHSSPETAPGQDAQTPTPSSGRSGKRK